MSKIFRLDHFLIDGLDFSRGRPFCYTQRICSSKLFGVVLIKILQMFCRIVHARYKRHIICFLSIIPCILDYLQLHLPSKHRCDSRSWIFDKLFVQFELPDAMSFGNALQPILDSRKAFIAKFDNPHA